jgi:hypothetical protein
MAYIFHIRAITLPNAVRRALILFLHSPLPFHPRNTQLFNTQHNAERHSPPEWFGDGDDTTRSRSSSVWLGFAQLLMPKEYDRVEAIRRHRREVKLKRKAEVEADAEAAAAEAVTAQQVIASAGDAERNQVGEAAAADGSAVGEGERTE